MKQIYTNKGSRPTKDGFGIGLKKAGETNSSVVALGADITGSVGADLFAKAFPERFFSLGIAEQNCVGVAAGMALNGKIPVFSTYGVFAALRTTDQIRISLCYNDVHVIIGGAHAGISVGPDGATHQALEDIAIMRVIPNMKVLIPADAVAVSKLTKNIAEIYGPFYMRMARSKVPTVYTDSQEFEIGKGITLRDGSDCTIAATGITVKMALDAAEKLHQDGISCRVIDCFTVKPIDKDILEKAARETGGIVTCEEHNVMGGFGSAVTEVVSETYPVPISRIGAQDKFGESARDDEIPQLLEKHGITSINIEKTVKDIRSKQ